jgi:hypothetical protein
LIGGVKVDLHLDARAADVAQWSRGEAPAELLKQNGARAVWRVAAGSPALYVKHFPRELFRDRARKEAGLLLDLEKAGIRARVSLPSPGTIGGAT